MVECEYVFPILSVFAPDKYDSAVSCISSTLREEIIGLLQFVVNSLRHENNKKVGEINPISSSYKQILAAHVASPLN